MYDLNFSKDYIHRKLLFSIFLTFQLWGKKSNPQINIYDKAINYSKLFKNRHTIDIFDDQIFINNEIHSLERHLDKYTIFFPNYTNENVFTEYLKKYYPVNESYFARTILRRSVEITKDEFENIIEELKLIVIDKSFYLTVRNMKIFIRKENFRFTIIFDKMFHDIFRNSFNNIDLQVSRFEDEKYIYYIGIGIKNLVEWVNNVA